MNPIPVAGWDTPRDQWLRARRAGIGASDVAALLGFIPQWCTPWQLWAEKTGHLPGAQSNENMELGHELEPWLIAQAPKLLGMGVSRTPHMLYRHPEHDWRQCSPDAFADDGGLVEAKTAKIGPSWGDPEGWDNNSVPLAYEVQAWWQMHVMDRPRVHIVALVAGMGRVVRTVERDMAVEYDLVRQVTDWYQTHIANSIEPPVEGHDVAALAERYATTSGNTIEVGLDAYELCLAYKEARDTESAAKKAKLEPKAQLQAILGDAAYGRLDNKVIVTWDSKKGEVDWERMARDLATLAHIPLPDPESYRKPSGRTLLVK